jgi:hypothetical protein
MDASSRGAEEQRSKGAEEQRGRGAEQRALTKLMYFDMVYFDKADEPGQ